MITYTINFKSNFFLCYSIKMSGVEKKVKHIFTDGIVLFKKGICVFVKDSNDNEKCIWFLCKYGDKQILNYLDTVPKNTVKELAPKTEVEHNTSMASTGTIDRPIKVEKIELYDDGLCVEITEDDNIWFTANTYDERKPALLIKTFYDLKQIYPNKSIPSKYGSRVKSPTEYQGLSEGGGYRKRKSIKKRKNTRRRNTRRKNTRRKNTRRKNTKRKKTRRRR